MYSLLACLIVNGVSMCVCGWPTSSRLGPTGEAVGGGGDVGGGEGLLDTVGH